MVWGRLAHSFVTVQPGYSTQNNADFSGDWDIAKKFSNPEES